jgi:hypothetical protein
MTADSFTAIRAAPLSLLIGKETIHTLFFYLPQIPNHAHLVFGMVTIVEAFQTPTGKIITFIAKPHQAFTNQFTMGLHESAIFSPRNTTRAVFSVKTLFF